MDLLSILRTLGGLATVLGILWGALWLVRRYDIQLPGLTGGGQRSRLELVERLAIDARRSVTLLRRDGAEHLILIAPEGHLVIESGLLSSAEGPKAKAASATTDLVVAPPGDRISRWEKLFGPIFTRSAEGPKAKADGATTDFVVAPRGDGISRWEKLFGPVFVHAVECPKAKVDSATTDFVVEPLGDQPTRWEKLFGPSFGQLVEEVRSYSVPVRPVIASANVEPIYPPARKKSTRRGKAAEGAAHA